MEFLNINESVQNAIRIAKGIAWDHSLAYYAPAHLLYALLHKDIGIESIVVSLGQYPAYIREWAESAWKRYRRQLRGRDNGS